MIEVTLEFKTQIMEAMLKKRELFQGNSDSSFAKTFDLAAAIYSRLVKGYKRNDFTGILAPGKWIAIARKLGVSPDARKWSIVRTDVVAWIEEEVLFCKENSKARIFCDDCEIGKTVALRDYLANKYPNCFYIDGSQCKNKRYFFRDLATVIGIDNNGTYNDLKANIKYALRMLEKPIIMIDEAGDLDYDTFLDLKEIWNATENCAGWYLVGADGLRAKLLRGIRNRKVGYAEIFSRFSSRFSKIVPQGREDRRAFYDKLHRDVAAVNMGECKKPVDFIVKQCMGTDGDQGGLRRMESILLLNTEKEAIA